MRITLMALILGQEELVSYRKLIKAWYTCSFLAFFWDFI